MKTYYLHTIDDQPAFFDGDQICFAGGPYARHKQPLSLSLRQIRREQRISAASRARWGMEDWGKRGYVRVHVPEAR